MTTPDLNHVAKVYKAIQNKQLALEFALRPYRMILEEAALNAPGMKIELERFKILLVEAHRENFNLRKAKETLPLQIIVPFIKVVSYSQLRVTEKPELDCIPI